MSWKKVGRDIRQRRAKIGDTPVRCLIIDSDYFCQYRLLVQSEEKIGSEYKTFSDSKHSTVAAAQRMCDAVIEVQNGIV